MPLIGYPSTTVGQIIQFKLPSCPGVKLRKLGNPKTRTVTVDNHWLSNIVCKPHICGRFQHDLGRRRCIGSSQQYTMIDRILEQVQPLNRLVNVSDTDCIDNLWMDRNTFGRLCFLLRHLGGLSDSKYVSVEEQVAMFLSILGHHKRNRVVKFDFIRSGQTISRYVYMVLKSILKLDALMLVKLEPVPDDNINPRWKWFKFNIPIIRSTYMMGPKIVDAFKEKGEPMYAAMKVIFEGEAANIEPDEE